MHIITFSLVANIGDQPLEYLTQNVIFHIRNKDLVEYEIRKIYQENCKCETVEDEVCTQGRISERMGCEESAIFF